MPHWLTDLIDPARFSERVRQLSESLGAAVGVVECDGVPLISSGQAPICRDHLSGDGTSGHVCRMQGSAFCQQAARELVAGACPHGLWGLGVPIHVLGDSLGSVIVGPYARGDQLADLDAADSWAEVRGPNSAALVKLLARLPVITDQRTAQVREAAQSLAAEVAAEAEEAMSRERRPVDRRGESALLAVLHAADELLAISDLDQLLRRAVEVARERLGVERIGLFLREGASLRGTYGTDLDGRTVDESSQLETGGVVVEMSRPGRRGWRVADTDLFVATDTGRQWIGTNWIGVTPVVVDGEAIGAFTNDMANSGGDLDPELQDRLAVYASLVGPLIVRLRNEAAEKVYTRLAAALAAADTVAELAEAAYTACGALFDPDCFFVAARSADGQHLHLPFVIDTIDGERERYGADLLLPDHYHQRLPQVVDGSPLLINRESGYTGPALGAVGARHQRSQSILFAPVMAAGEFAGLISVQSYATAKYDQSDVRRLVRITEVVAPALGRTYAHDRLRLAQARQQALLDATPDPYLVLDHDGRYVSVHAPERLRLYRPEELIGRTVHDIFDAETAARHLATVRQAIDEQACLTMEYRLERGGREVWFEGRAAPMGDLCAWLARDITARKLAEAEHLELESQLRQAIKMEAVGQLAGGVAHDFNNLLTTITGYADLLESSLRGTELEDDIAEVSKAAARAGQLTRQLLAFSRRQVFRREVFDLSDVVADLSGMLNRLLGADVELVDDLATTPLLVSADRGQIEQVIVNLAVNARDAMPQGGRLRLSTRAREIGADELRSWPELRAGAHVQLDVADTGCGMDAATLARAFEPFFTTKPRGAGTGLGLSMVYGIVHQSNGHVICDSQVGHGTTFSVLLPRVTTSQPNAEPRDDLAEPSGGGETVLLVEDEPAVRALARRVLARAGYRVLEAADGLQALSVAGERGVGVDLLLTDVMMPGMNGHELAQRLLAERPELPVLYISGYSEAVLSRRGALAEGTQLLAKPFSPRVLLARVRDMLDNRQ